MTGTGLSSPHKFVRDNEREACDRMSRHERAARKDVTIGRCGTDYFYGQVEVVALVSKRCHPRDKFDHLVVTLRDVEGKLHQVIVAYWLGLVEEGR